jgi:hypothetical protein
MGVVVAAKHDVDSPDESEFGLGSGLIDPIQRAGRFVSAEQELQEIYALPKSFDGSYPDRKKQDETPVPRLLPGESEADRG